MASAQQSVPSLLLSPPPFHYKERRIFFLQECSRRKKCVTSQFDFDSEKSQPVEWQSLRLQINSTTIKQRVKSVIILAAMVFCAGIPFATKREGSGLGAGLVHTRAWDENSLETFLLCQVKHAFGADGQLLPCRRIVLHQCPHPHQPQDFPTERRCHKRTALRGHGDCAHQPSGRSRTDARNT